MATDPNWFSSTLAQCGAAIVSFIGALLIARIHQQLAVMREHDQRFRQAEHDLQQHVSRIREKASAFSAYVTSILPSIEAAVGKRTSITSRTLDSPADMQEERDVTPDGVAFFKMRRHIADSIVATMDDIKHAKCAGNLLAHRERLQTLHAELQLCTRDESFLTALLATLDDLIDTGARLRAQGSVKFTLALTLVLAALSAIAVVIPLSSLSAYSATHKLAYLTLFAIALLLIPVVLLVQILDIRRLSTARLFILTEPPPLAGVPQVRAVAEGL